VSLLNEIDPDPECEPNLGSTDCLGTNSQEICWGQNGATTDDREKTGYSPETEDEEPTLGWGAGVCQTSLQQGYSPDGTEGEPSLAGLNCVGNIRAPLDVGMSVVNGRAQFADRSSDWNQENWGRGNCADLEGEHDGREPDDADYEADYHGACGVPPKGYTGVEQKLDREIEKRGQR
jgi:hypothetical protein